HLQVHGQGPEDRLGRRLARCRVPAPEGPHRIGQRVVDDLVLDRTEQHVRDRRDEGDEHEDQQWRDQRQCTELLAAPRAREALLQRCPVGGLHRAGLGGVAPRSPVRACGRSRSECRGTRETNGVEGAPPGPCRSVRAPCPSRAWTLASRSSRWSAHQGKSIMMMFVAFAGSGGMCGAISMPSSACLPTSGADDLRAGPRSEEHTSELQSRENLVCRLLLEKKKNNLKEDDRRHQKCK